MPDGRVLVVGTTADYIDLLFDRFPDRVLFLTDTAERNACPTPIPAGLPEKLADLNDVAGSCAVVDRFLDMSGIRLSGISAFDCESLHLAAVLAEKYDLPFPSISAVRLARDKFLSKQYWQAADIACPKAALVSRLRDAVSFAAGVNNPVVLKPLTGSGSELTFLCRDRGDIVHAFTAIGYNLANHSNVRMYGPEQAIDSLADRSPVCEIEEFVDGREYSADFMIDGDFLTVIRVARKIPDRRAAFGTTLAYVLPVQLPVGVTLATLELRLLDAARALGLRRALCMVDFIVNDDEIILLELTPRPSGDCLPQLINKSLGLDMFQLALDFAENKVPKRPVIADGRRLVGMRLIASRAGRIVELCTDEILRDYRVVEVALQRKVDDIIVLPPENYDLRVLGHVLFSPHSRHSIETECIEIASKLKIELEACHDQEFYGGHDARRRDAASADARTA